MKAIKRLIITPGESAGIGPELVCKIAGGEFPGQQLIVCGDSDCLLQTAQQLKLPLELEMINWQSPAQPHQTNQLWIEPVALAQPAVPGKLNPDNSQALIDSLTIATQRCLNDQASAMITGPVHKGVLNQAGFAFSGHTEFLQAQANVSKVVMMLATPGLRVCLATTHLPIVNVSEHITQASLRHIIAIILRELEQKFALRKPRLGICGLNPHAGEQGYLGREEIDIIDPVIQEFVDQGHQLSPAQPADSIFTPKKIAQYDCILAMYHDQGLPVLKHLGFEKSVNITLGLPFIRTSVDHGTALDIAGCNTASPASLRYAIAVANELAGHHQVNGAVHG